MLASQGVLAGGVFLTAFCTPAIVNLATVEALTAERCPHDTSSSVGRHSCLLAGLVSGAGDCRKKPIQRTARGFQMRWKPPILFSLPAGVAFPVDAVVCPRIGCAAVPDVLSPVMRRLLGDHVGVVVMG